MAVRLTWRRGLNIVAPTWRRGLASAAVCTSLGAPLEVQHDRPTDPGPKQVAIKVAAAGVNYADVLQAKGLYQDKAETPYVPGNESAGEVCAVGAGVENLAIGDRVICVSRGGAQDRTWCTATPCTFH